MFDSNPNLIQETPDDLRGVQPPPAPVVLIHDGGGTIFSYYCLGWLNRPVYGIYNPHYGTDKVWADGVAEMARHYVQLIKQVIPEGDIILGGWSMGGLLSLQVSRLLAEDPKIRVLGIIMIDSVYPRAPQLTMSGSQIVQHAAEWSNSTKQETKDAVKRCFDEAIKMIRAWTLPTWETADKDDHMYEPAGGRSQLKPPPVWLLRAQEPVPVLEKGVSRVDLYRQDRYLGWNRYRPDLIVRVEDIPGHHFNIFNFDHVDVVTEKLKQACIEIEERTGRR